MQYLKAYSLSKDMLPHQRLKKHEWEIQIQKYPLIYRLSPDFVNNNQFGSKMFLYYSFSNLLRLLNSQESLFWLSSQLAFLPVSHLTDSQMIHINKVPRAGRCFLKLNYLDTFTHKSSQNSKGFAFVTQKLFLFPKSHALSQTIWSKCSCPRQVSAFLQANTLVLKWINLFKFQYFKF